MRFEFLPAFKGDCFLIHGGTENEPVLILVDGGPGGTYQDHLRPRLMALRDERGLEDHAPLVIDLVVVSHVDDDHINGVIALLQEMHDRAVGGDTPLFEIRELWHNSFDDILGNNEVTVQAAQFGAASFAPFMEDAEDQTAFDAGLILQSVAQGQRLRDLALSDELAIPLNGGAGGLIQTGVTAPREFGGITFTVVGPRQAELAKLQQEHDDWLEAQRKKGQKPSPQQVLQALTDESVANLSSIVLLAERDGRTALLTGDARSDFIEQGLAQDGLLAADGTLRVDLLKMPHHGSDRNVDQGFLTRITAPAYLFSGNGEHGNPERETLEMLRDARPGAAVTCYLTYSLAEIDQTRRQVHEQERGKELRRQAAGRMKADALPRPAWSDQAHSVTALVATLPGSMRVEEPQGSSVPIALDGGG